VDAPYILMEEPQPGDCSQPLGALPRAVSRSPSLGRYHNRKPQLLRVSGPGRRVVLPVSPTGKVLSDGLLVRVLWRIQDEVYSGIHTNSLVALI